MDEQQDSSNARSAFSKKEIKNVLKTFSPLEQLGFFICVVIAFFALISLLSKINEHFLVPVPASGGTLHEGVIGTPRFVNPLLASTDADRDITRLVFRGLMQKDGEGNIIPDIAESYTVSADGLVYTFKLKDAYFDDKQPITADDVFFTVKSAQDATLKSSKRVEWIGVMAKVEDPKTITFTLKQAYAPFLESTTLGIIPKHIWEKISYEGWIYSDNNSKKVVGSGPYKIKSISQNSSGIPDFYELVASRTKNGPSPLIDTIEMHFYSSEDSFIAGYENGTIDVLGGIDPEKAKILSKEGAHILSSPLPRVFGLFFNQSNAKIFTDATVRKAIRTAINNKQVVNDVLLGYGETITSPVPTENISSSNESNTSVTTNADDAKKILEKAGWKLGGDGIYVKSTAKAVTTKTTTKKGTKTVAPPPASPVVNGQRLSFEIATNDVPELKQAVDIIVSNLRAAGIEAIPKVYETSSLNQDIIRPRKFQSLFFGEVVSNQSDLFAFWHSSQRNDPGLNISGYANPKTDKLLETALHTLDTSKLDDIYNSFEKEISADIPAVFIYSPTFIYAVRPTLDGITLGRIKSPEDRFNSINNWYLTTDRVWSIFAKN